MQLFWSKVDALELWHRKLIDKIPLQSFKPTKLIVTLIILSAFIAASMNWYVRNWQYQVWEQNPEIFYLDDGTPLFTTTDAPYYLGLAKALKTNDDHKAFEAKRLYPENVGVYSEQASENSIFDAPLLSVILAKFAKNDTPLALLNVGNVLLQITAVVTTFMIMFPFAVAGYWLPGIIAAAGSGLSSAYLMRSGAGRIDTDQLNLGFFYLLLGLVFWTAKSKNIFMSSVLSFTTGIVFQLFQWWYPKPIFGWLLLCSLLWMSFFSSKSIKFTLVNSIIFLLVSGLAWKGLGLGEENVYLTETFSVEGLFFPNALDTVTEVRSINLVSILDKISGSVFIGIVSIAGLSIWAFRHPIIFIAFLPAILFAFLNYVVGSRAIFYSAPIFWFGLGFIVLLCAKLVLTKSKDVKLGNASLIFAVVLGLFSAWHFGATKHVSAPTFSKEIVANFIELKDEFPSENSVVVTWWDYGYASMFFNDFPTIHDGGSQTRPATFFIAEALIDSSQEKLAFTLRQLVNDGSKSLLEAETNGNHPFTDSSNKNEEDIYLVLTSDMVGWFPSISQIGAWDLKKGSALSFEGVPKGQSLSYTPMQCKQTNKPEVLNCEGSFLNIKTGVWGDNFGFDGNVVLKNGNIVSGQKYLNSNRPFALQAEISAGQKIICRAFSLISFEL